MGKLRQNCEAAFTRWCSKTPVKPRTNVMVLPSIWQTQMYKYYILHHSSYFRFKSKDSCRDLCSPPQYIYIIVIHILDLFKVYPTFWFCSELNITENIAHFSLTAGKISPGSRDWNLQTHGKHKFLWQIRGSQRWFFSSLTAGRILDQRETKNNTQPWDSSVVLQNVFPGVWQPPTLLVQGHTGVYRTKCSVCVCVCILLPVYIFSGFCVRSLPGICLGLVVTHL